MENVLKHCTLCPRKCGVDRTISTGYCGCKDKLKLALCDLHYWEEPCISGTSGSGAVFFSGCQLKCCFCQNKKISAENFGKEITVQRLAEIFLELQNKKANNINLISGTQYIPYITKALDIVKGKLHIPVIYNSSGYESISALKLLEGYIDVYLPDFKYFNNDISLKYSKANDYFEVASKAIKEMFRQTGKISFYSNGIIKKGVIIRHLVLPNNRNDSIKIINWIAENFKSDEIYLSLMSQYTPYFHNKDYPELNRKVSTFEYNKVLEVVQDCGIKGYLQEKTSAKEEYTPDFNLKGL